MASMEDNFIVYLGLACYFAEQRGRQNMSGDMIGQVLRLPTKD